MFLDEIISAQKRGLAIGIPSICSAHPWVIKEALQLFRKAGSCLIEPTCHQVNQYGGYTGMTPADFVGYVRGLAEEVQVPFENVLLGGDHLGPGPWQNEDAGSALQKSEVLVRDYILAGFVKIHLDCSMRLGDDPPGALDPVISAQRTARLAKAAEAFAHEGTSLTCYVIGTEVPLPGGAPNPEAGVVVTGVEDLSQTLDLSREAFAREGLTSAWDRVVAVVVQPGVEFGDDFVIEFHREQAGELSRFIERQPLVFEAHSTDYQPPQALIDLVRDHFAILKVGPALTFAFREAVFALAMMEDELVPMQSRSNLVQVLDQVMIQNPEHWSRYYRGSEQELAFKRKYSFSDRARYYWTNPKVQAALQVLIKNLGTKPLPLSVLGQFAPMQYERTRRRRIPQTPQAVISDHLRSVLGDYEAACGW